MDFVNVPEGSMGECEWCGYPEAHHKGGIFYPDGSQKSGFFCNEAHFKLWVHMKTITFLLECKKAEEQHPECTSGVS